MRLPNAFSLLRHPVIREWLVIVLVLVMTALFSLRGEWFSRLDQSLYDQAIGLWQRPTQSDIVVIGIDEDSIRQFGRWPWSRTIHATLVNALTKADAKAIALDIILSEADQRDPTGDALLAQAIQKNQRVVLPVTARISEDAVAGEALPIPEFTASAARIGHIATLPDTDGVVRLAYLRGGVNTPSYDLLALAALAVAEPKRWLNPASLPGEKVVHSAGRDAAAQRTNNGYLIPYAGPPGHFKAVSYLDVLSPDFELNTLNGKIVLVGATASNLADEFPTPVSGGKRAMSGIEIHANVLQGLREGINLSVMPLWLSIMITICVLLSLLLAYLWLSPRQSIVLTALFAVGVIVLTGVLFRYAMVWMSPVSLLFCLLLAYPLWSWRKLEATQSYFNEELASLEREPSIVSLEAVRTLAPQQSKVFVPDVVEQRIVALRAATERMRGLNRFVVNSIESLPEAALVTDFNGKVMLANTSADRLFGATTVLATLSVKRQPAKQQPLEGRDVFDLMSDIQHHESRNWRELWADVAVDTNVITVEATGPNDFEYLVQIAPSFSHSGLHTATIVTITDISPLRESERRRDEALRFLSHDMRSPQASILTLLEMQREDPASMPSEKLNDRIGRYARRTLTLADDFLRLAKAERVKPQDFEPLDLSELLRDASEEGWTLASAKNIKIVCAVPEEEAWVSGDRDLLTRVLMNLLSNAIKYSPPATTVTCRLQLESSEQSPMWAMEIIDQGYGIADADASKLFTRFARIRQEGQPEEDGIGLGLVFVKTVVQRHNGSIGVKSKIAKYEGATRGTTFTVKLPATEAPAD